MSGITRDIQEWERLNLDWQYIESTIFRPRTIPANGQLQLPIDDYTFSYPEIVLLQFTAGFDHPRCGIRIEANPEFDTREDFTALNLASVSRPENLVYILMPPFTPPGIYAVRIPSAWRFNDWMKIYLINTDSVPHRVIAHGYHIAVLKEKRPELNNNDLETIKLLLELYPEMKDELKSEVRSKFDYWLKLRELGVTVPRR